MSNSENLYYEYKIKNGDTFSGIIHSMFGVVPKDTRYAETVKFLLALNPQIQNPDRIRAGSMLRLGVLPPKPQTDAQIAKVKETVQGDQGKFITESVSQHDMDNFWALAWLEHNANYLTIPGGIAAGAAGNLLSPGNVNLLNEVSDEYAKYKSGEITKSQYDYRRKRALDMFKANVGPFEKWMFGKNTTHETIRIARAGGIPATANIAKHADRLKSLAAVSKGAGIALVGVGLTSACLQIANTTDTKEKNEIFVETITSTTVGVLSGVAITAFLVSNPVGWGTAIVLAVSSAGASWGLGKGARNTYDLFGPIDFVTGTGTDRICK
ncbi:MAG: LysM peptidoglycan-binding domain-containing protein [Gammaproteobacteria bacterium]|nr:LysM peptidoglycan-binding domain-containing protein [Gammaproteobacteria bacterium]